MADTQCVKANTNPGRLYIARQRWPPDAAPCRASCIDLCRFTHGYRKLTEYCKARGFEYKQMELEDGIFLAVAEARCRYASPARFDEEVVIVSLLQACVTAAGSSW
jgi:hypothetical protein